ncbi:hypothetical protein TIFTF001_006140 [Ficus carica]|uniref:Calcium-transporting ATPase n=1 Tax=Ficus carica TaxID=3494 RepID=A0AA88DFE7_FICCA|nr:hypothetical protein TIFTF001_006140 [Ficus carica]
MAHMSEADSGLHVLDLESLITSTKASSELSVTLPQASQDDVHLDIFEENQSGTANTGDHANLQHTNIAKMVRTKNLDSLRNQFGGIEGIAGALNADLESAITGDEDDLNSRRVVGTPPLATEVLAPGFFGFLGQHCNDCTILLLFLAAALYTGFGIKKEGPKTGWYQGAIIVIVIVIIVAGLTIRDLWLQHLQRKKVASERMEQKEVVVLRGKCSQKVSVSEIVSGDVVILDEGSLVPADGLFIVGESLVVNDGLESSIDEDSPFLSYGSKVSHGKGRMLVTSLGTDTEFGEAMSKVAACTPKMITLPAQLDKLRKIIQIAGLSICILIVVVLFLGLMLGRSSHVANPSLPELKSKPTATVEIMEMIRSIVVNPSESASTIKAPVSVVLVGVLEGIPFVIMLAAIYWRKKMLAGKVSAPGLLDCVKMGSATTICTDKTPLNPTDVAMCFIGDHQVIETSFIDVMAEPVREALCRGISAPLVLPSSPCKVTEDPLLPWATSRLEMKLDVLRQSCRIVKTEGLSSKDEGSGVLMKKEEDGREVFCSHWKGPATTILGKCSRYYHRNGDIMVLNEEKKELFERNIGQMQLQGLKTVTFACEKIDNNPILEENNLILIGVLGLEKHKCCTETEKALEDFKDAGVKIRLVSEDDASELEEIARACEILPTNGLVIKGEDFENYDKEERMDKVDKIYVMGNSLPSHRLLLVQCLKEKGNVVVALGTRTNDSPVLKEADLGVAMGAWSSEMARESSDIIVYDGSLSSLPTIVSCGRCTYYNIQKYIQLELVTNIAGTLITSLCTVFLGDTPITGFHLIWANLVVTVLAGSALLLEPPSEVLMRKPPFRQTEPLISKPMWRNIVIQAIYQTTILVTFHYKGQAMKGITKKVNKSMIFTSFVLCQVFNLVNSRELEKKNVLKGILQNPWFWVAVVIIVALQECFTEVAHILVGDAKLNMVQWSACILIGMGSCPVDIAAKCASNLIKNRRFRSHVGFTTMTHASPPSYSISNLELPLTTPSDSTSLPLSS